MQVDKCARYKFSSSSYYYLTVQLSGYVLTGLLLQPDFIFRLSVGIIVGCHQRLLKLNVNVDN